VPGVFGRHPFAVKHMPQMAFAIGADDFDAPHPESIVFVANDGTGYFVVERRPAAAAVEFVARTVKRRIASAANIRTRRFVIPIFAGKCPFGAFFGNYMRFFSAEVIPVIHVFKILSEVKIFARAVLIFKKSAQMDHSNNMNRQKISPKAIFRICLSPKRRLIFAVY
jgi:hypothetical protein